MAKEIIYQECPKCKSMVTKGDVKYSVKHKEYRCSNCYNS